MASNTRSANGSGTIYYSEKGEKWVAELQWSDRNGTRHVKKFSGKKKTAVKNKLEDFKRKLLIANGDFGDDDVLFQEYADEWLHTILRNSLKPTSYTRKEVTLQNQVYPHLGGIPINRITHSDVQNMVNDLADDGLSYSTIKKAYEAVSGCLANYRVKTGTYLNPCEGVTLPSNSTRDVSDITFFDADQRKLIYEEAVRRYGSGKSVYRLGNAIIVLMYTGLRVGELLALTWNDIDFENRTITVGKNAVVAKVEEKDGAHYRVINQKSTKTQSGNRIIPMTETAYNTLMAIKEINGNQKYVMSSANGKQITPRNINRMFHSILTKTGIANGVDELCGVHTLRHTFASMLFKNKCDVKIVSELLGHADTKIT